MGAFLDQYRYYLKVERSLSANTVDSYLSDLKDFFSATAADPAVVDKGTVLEYIGKRDISDRSQARMLSSFRSFFSWMQLSGFRADNPCENVDFPKLARYLPSVLSIEEVDSIINSVDMSAPSGARDRAILETLYGCGLRVSELTSLRISDIFFAESLLRIIGKGNKQRIVPLGEEAAEALKRAINERPIPKKGFEDMVFLNKTGSGLSRVSVFKMIKKQALIAGITKEISPHTFRHSFATHMIENGADLRIVQDMLGHESILTTEIYTHIDTATWQSNILSHHPHKEE